MNEILLLWLAIVALVTLITRPTSPTWLKEGKAVFLILLIEAVQKIYIYFYPPVPFYTPPFDGPYDFYHYASEVIVFIWVLAMLNMPVGVAEFLRRLYYRQWHRNFWKNFQYGYISTASMYSAFPVAAIFAFFIFMGVTSLFF